MAGAYEHIRIEKNRSSMIDEQQNPGTTEASPDPIGSLMGNFSERR